MAVTFKKTNQGFVNFWTQLKDIVSTKSLYNTADYDALAPTQKEQYLTMLYQNNDALASRLPEEYASEYGDADTRFALLAATNAKYQFDLNWANADYQKTLNEQIDRELDTKLASDIDKDKDWVDWLVQNRYDGSYSKFVADYSGDDAKTYQDAIMEMVPEEYELTEDTFFEGVSRVSETREDLYNSARTSQDTAYGNTLQYVREKLKATAEKEAYDNATAVEKIFNTIWQIPTLMSAEIVEIVEGLGDAIITAVGTVEEIFTLGYGSTAWAESAIEYDWWAPETWLNVETSASYLNKYADDNAAKWLYETGVSIIDMAPLALNAVAPGLGTTVYYASAAGKTMEAELAQGYSFGESFVSTIGTTAIEFATEKISGSKFFGGGIFKKWEKFGGMNLGTKIVHDAVGEGLEEVISEIGSDIWHGAVTGDFNLIGQEKAGAQLLKTFAIGGLVGGIMVGGNAAVQSHVISKSAVMFKDNTGKSFSISPAKAAIIQDFVQKTGKKVESGKDVSERTRRNFDALKNFKIQAYDTFGAFVDKLAQRVDKLQAMGKDITASELARLSSGDITATLKAGYYEETVAPKIRRKTRLLELVRGVKDGTLSKDAAKQAFAEEAAALRDASNSKAGNTETMRELIEDTGLDKTDLASIISEALDTESREQNQKDLQISGAMTLGKLMKMFGEDSVTEGVNLAVQYIDKTINEVAELAQLGTEESAFNKLNTDTSILNQHFANANFVLVEAKANTAIADKYSEICTVINTLHKNSNKMTKDAVKDLDVRLFFTTGSTVSTSFFIDNVLYINSSWLAEADTGRIKDVLISKYCVERARQIIDNADKYKQVKTLLREVIAKVNDPNRSAEIMQQELAYIMFFQRGNILLKQILSYAPDKSGVTAVIEYFDALRTTYSSLPVQKAAGAGLSNIVATLDEVMDTGEEPKTEQLLPADRTTSVKDIVDAYQNMNFRSFPFITGKNGLSVNAAKVDAMYRHMRQTFGFNKELDLTKRINWIKQFTNSKNFDNDGYARLTEELNKFQNIRTSTGYTRSTVPKNKTFSELLNYYLDATCGLMVFSNGVISESEMTTQVLRMDALSELADKLALRTDAPRNSVGTVADFLSLTARGRLLPVFQNIPIYVTFEQDSSAQASIIGDTDSGMAIVINLTDAARLSKDKVTIGGMQLVLDENGELVKTTDGSFAVHDYSDKVSKLAYDIGHEIGHSIGMMLGFNGTFCETDIATAYNIIIDKASATERATIINSIISWLTDGENVKPGMRAFARHLGITKAEIEASPEKADAAILKYVARLQSAIKTKPDKAKRKSLFTPLAEYLYFTGFANEMFANGKPEAVAREDIIHSHLQNISDNTVTVLRTTSDLEFIKVLNGYALLHSNDSEFLENWLTEIQDSPENVTRRIFTGLKNVTELAEALDVTFAHELVSPDFWASKIKKPNVSVTRSQLISTIEENYDCTYDNITKEFSQGFVSKSIREDYTMAPRVNDSFSAILLNDGKVINAKNHSAYSDDSKIAASIMYQPAAGNRRANLTIQLNTEMSVSQDKTTGILSVGNISLPVPPHTTAVVIAGGKVFRSLKAAKRYLSSQSVASKNVDFESIFERVIEQATEGKQLKYPDDVIYITADGKVYNTDITMADWNGYANLVFGADTAKVEALFGEYTKDTSGNFVTENPEGIAYNLSRLLDDKRIVRLYRDGDNWKAYGTPNKIQDNLVNSLKAERMTATSYVDMEPDRKLFVTLEGDKPKVAIHSNNWSKPGYHEVDWKVNKWYTSIRQIMTRYGITKLQDFELLGFSQDFINQLKSGKNLGEKVFYDYLRDDTNTDYSRNILIENCPESSRENESGNWKNNPNIHSMAEAKEYWELAAIFADIMPVNIDKSGNEIPIVYNTVVDLKLAMEKISKDPINKPIIDAAIEQRDNCLKVLGSDIYIQLLNKDSNTGLSLDKKSFSQAVGYIRQYAESFVKRKSAKHEVSLDIEEDGDDGSHSMIRPDAENLELPSAFRKVDESGPRDKIYTGYMAELKDIAKIEDVDDRNAAYRDLLDTLKFEQYTNYEYRDLLENTILNKIEGVELDQYRRAKLESTRERIEKYKTLEENSPEQLKERRKLIRYYEQLSNQKLNIMSDDGKDYYNAMLKIIGEVGAYSKRMNQAFAHQYKKAAKLRETIKNKDAFDAAIDKFREIRTALLQVDMEYPGWYTAYDNLLQLMKDYLSGKTLSQGKTMTAVRTDIINFVNAYDNATEFRQSIAQREKVSDYIFAKSVRGAKLFDADLERFSDIPSEIKDILSFPKDARKFYNVYKSGKKSPADLAKLLKNTDAVELMLRQWGQDFVYNLRRLYNELITPAPGSGISLAKKSLNDLMELAEFDEETVTEIKESLVKPTYNETIAAAKNKRKDEYLDYRQLAIKNAERLYKFLAAGNPVGDDARKKALQAVSNAINEYRWPVNRRYYTVRLDVRGLSNEAKAAINARLAKVDKRRQSNAVYTEKNEAGEIEYFEFLSKASPYSEAPHHSDIRSIGAELLRTKAGKGKKKGTRQTAVYQNVYYDTRAIIQRILQENGAVSRISYKDTEANRHKYRHMFIDTSGIPEKDLNIIKQKVSKVTQEPLDDKEIKALGGILIISKLEDPNVMPKLLVAVRNAFEPTELSRLTDSTRHMLSYKALDELSESQKYRITRALMHAYYALFDNPKTDRSIDKFNNDVGVALEYGMVDKTIPGNKTERVAIQVPDAYKEPWWDPEKTVDVDEYLKPIFDAELKEGSTQYQDALEKFRAETELVEELISDAENEAKDETAVSNAEQLRQKRIAWDKRKARESTVTVIEEGDPYDVVFNTESGKFESGNTELPESDVDFRQLEHDVLEDYFEYYKEKGLAEGWLKESRAGNIVDPETKKIVIYGNKASNGNSVRMDTESLSEDDFVFEEDGEPESMSEEDFVFDDETDGVDSSGISNYIEDDMMFEPLSITEEEFAAIDAEITEKAGEYETRQDNPKPAKGTWVTTVPDKRYYQVKTGLSENTAKLLDYKPRKWDEQHSFDSAEFLTDNASYLNIFTNSEADMSAFISRIESNPNIPIDSPQEAIIFALLNKVYNRAAVVNNLDLKARADALIKRLSARAGRILGMTRKYGVTPIEQLATLCSNLLNLSDDERQLLSDLTTVQINAIATYNYTRANEAMDEVINLLKKHEAELPASMNIFAKGINAEERTARWTNIANKVSSWKYFAMLGTPTTFFTKNIASNLLMSGMDAVAERIAGVFNKVDTFAIAYSFDETLFEGIAANKTFTQLTESDVAKLVKKTVTNANDAAKVDISKLTKELNAYIKTRYNIDKAMPTASKMASKANEWMRKHHYQYQMNKSSDATIDAVVDKLLVESGLLAGIMSDTVAKYDTGYDTKISKLRNIVLNEETKFDELSEADSSVLAAAIRRDAPFGKNPNSILNRYYRFIFKTMELGDKKFIEPKIKKTVGKLIASNMTDAEIRALQNNNTVAREKFEEFVQYATNDAMKTYFRDNSEFQNKVMRLLNKHPIAQMIFGSIMPFPRMALNTMGTVLSYSPLGFIKAVHIASTSQDAFTKLKVSKELGKAITGSTLIGIGAILAAAGILDFDDDDEYGGAQLIIGNKIRIAIGDLAPSILPLVIGATMTNGFTEGFWNGIYNGGDALLDATLLGEAIEIFGGNKSAVDVVTDMFTAFVNQFVPSVFRHMARSIDPTQKKYSSNKGLKIIQRIAAALPVASRLVPAKIDPYTGNAIYQNTGSDAGWAHVLSFVNAFSPAKITANIESDVEIESKAVGAPTTGPAKTYTIDGVQYTIPDELYRDYQALRAKLYSSYAKEIINTNSYQKMTIAQKKAKLSQLQSKATREARKQLNIGK